MRPLLIRANALRLPLLDSTVQCVVTSPPYWGGIRNYAGEQEVVWGDGARCAYGHEPTVALYVQHTIEILREIRRVLRPDGVVFWNIDDTRANDSKWGGATCGKHAKALHGEGASGVGRERRFSGLKPKDLCLIPQRVTIAAQDDGWWVRSVIMWAKDNPMPESMGDRPTDAYETILMLTAAENYYWDAEAVREPGSSLWPLKKSIHLGVKQKILGQNQAGHLGLSAGKDGRNIRNVWMFKTSYYRGAHSAVFPEELPTRAILAASKPGDIVLDPFGGSGTTGKVAQELQRRAVLVDIAYTGDGYGVAAAKRTAQGALSL